MVSPALSLRNDMVDFKMPDCEVFATSSAVPGLASI